MMEWQGECGHVDDTTGVVDKKLLKEQKIDDNGRNNIKLSHVTYKVQFPGAICQ